MEVEKLSFDRKKYGVELLLDCALYSSQPIVLNKRSFKLDFYGIYLVTSGTGEIVIDTQTIPFKKGTLVFFQPGQVTQWNHVTENFDGYFLVFESEFIATFFHDAFFIYRFQFFNYNLSNSIDCEGTFFSHLSDLCKQINAELHCLQDDSHHFLRSLLYTILIEVNRKFISTYNLSRKLFQDNTSIQFLKLIDAHFKEYHKVEDYVKLMHLSRSQLNLVLQASTGKPASALIKERLITEIKRELLFTDKSIKEICYALNFSDVPNFIRFFKNAVGLNPAKYRVNHSK